LAGSLITFGGTLDSDEYLEITGDAQFDGAVSLEYLTVSGTSALNGGAVTTTGIQTYTGATRLGVDTALAGSMTTFGSTLDSDEYLEITGNARFYGAVSLEYLTVSSASALNGGSVTTTGVQTYTGAATLGVDAALAGSLITFGGTLDSDEYLEITGDARFDGAVSLEYLTVSGTSALNGGAVTTTGVQTYTGAATLGVDTALAGSLITFSSTLDGTEYLEITGDAQLDGAVSLEYLTVSGASALNGGLVTTTGIQTYTGAVTLGADTVLAGSSITFGAAPAGTTISGGYKLTVQADDDVTVNASVETGDDLNIEADTVNLNGDISADAVVLTGDVRILKDIVIEAPGGLTINGTLSGDYDLTVHTGDMNLRVTGETSLGALTIEEAADVEFGAVTAASLAQLAGTGTTRLMEGVVLNGAAGMNIATADIEVEDNVTSAAGPIVLMASGDVEINGPIQSAAGGIRLNADRDGDGAGGLVIASTATASVTSAAGDIMLNGNDVAVGSAGFTATVTASEGGIVITAGRAGVVTVANDDSVFFAAGDVTIGDPNGGEGTPGQVDLTGWLTADNAISVRSLGDVNIDNLHARATNNIGVYADDDIIVNNSLIVSLSGIISLIPDADGDQSGTLVQLNTRLIEGVTLPDLAAGVTAYKMPAAVLAGTAGRVRVTISNEGQCRASGRVDVLLFLSSTSTLGDDAVLLAMKNNVRINHKPGKSTSRKLRFTIPADMTDGDYYLIAQIVPNINVMDLNASNNTAASPDALIVCKPDLTPSSVVSNLAASVLTGTTGQAVVHVDNIGLVPADETVQVRVYATTTGTLEGAVEVGRTTVALSLNAGAGKDVAVSLAMPDVFGEYRLLAVVDATNTLAEDNEANNTLLGDQVIVAADRFVDLEAAADGSTLAGPKLAGGPPTAARWPGRNWRAQREP
jgi:cytoskeletal protein CcmA (bactofilin family)